MPLHNQTKLLKDTAVNTSSQWIDDMNALEESFRDIVEDQRVAFELRMKEIAAKEMRLLKQNEEYIRRDRALREREAALDKMEEYTRNMVAVLLQQPATREQPSQRPENRGDSVYTADKDIDRSSGYITWEKKASTCKWERNQKART
eukprot:Tbor_TRINITY_DN5556_c0_g2::TRINITY_DN5556_c0_g2_i6::g.13862::m.13862